MDVRCSLTSVCGQIWCTRIAMLDEYDGLVMVKFCIASVPLAHCTGV
jgi:hypothetical protein